MKTNKILAVALSAGLVLGGASVAHAGGSGGAGGSTAEQPVDPDALNAAKTEAIYKLMAAGKSIDEANAIVRDAKTIDELNTAVEKALNPTPDPNPNPDLILKLMLML